MYLLGFYLQKNYEQLPYHLNSDWQIIDKYSVRFNQTKTDSCNEMISYISDRKEFSKEEEKQTQSIIKGEREKRSISFFFPFSIDTQMSTHSEM